MNGRTRRSALLGAGAVVAASVAAAVLWRKPPPLIHTPLGLAPNLAPGLAPLVPDLFRPARPMAAARFEDAEGRTHTLADFAGRALLVNLWATWCPPCVAEMPSLDRAARMLAKDSIAVIALSSDIGGVKAVRAFFATHHISTLTVWLDPEGAAMHAWGARGLPTTYLIDRAGRARGRMEWGTNCDAPASLALVRRILA